MSSASLVVPLALWNQIPNTQVTCAAFKVGHLVTGLKTGQIWIYRCRVKGERGEVELEPKVLCIGHKSTVAALTIIEGYTDGSAGNDYVIISASDDGEVMKWCLLDGRCLVCVSRAFNGFPRSLKPLASSGQVVRIWAGHNDWVACTPFYDSDARQILLLTANFNGKLRIWTFDEQKKTIIKEHDNVGELDAHGDKILELTSNPYDIGVILSISRKCAIIFTIRRDKVLNVQGIVSPHSNVIWTGGMFLSKTRVLLWTKTGEAYLYLLPINSERKIQPELGNLMLRAGPTSPVRRSSLPLIPTTENLSSSSAKPLLLESVHRNDNDSEIHSAITTVFSPTNLEENTNIWYLISFRNRPSGTAYAWKSLPTTHILHAGDKGNSEAKWSQERNLASIWPLETLRNHLNQNTSQVTITTNVYDDQIAMGYENGEIRLVPIYLALTQNVQILNFPDIQLLIGHVGRVTCIYSPNMNTFGKKYLLSGGADCSVRIWSFENGKRLAVFTVHSQPVKKFLEPPSDVGVRIRGCVISVAKDNSLAFISLEEMSCLYIFGGYPYPIMGIQWRPSEDSLLLSYGDETVHVWQMQSGSLDRILKGSTARMMIGDKQWKISRIASADNIKGNQSKGKTLSSFAIDSTENSTSPLHIFMINIKQLINDIYHYHVSALGSFSFNKTNGVMVETDERGREFDEKDGTQSKIFSWTTTSQIPNAPQSSNSTLYSQLEPESGALGASVVQGLVSALMSWEIDGSLDKICVERLGLKKPINNITFGIRGANGNLSIAAPSCQPGKSIWQISPAMTAIHLLSIVGLTRSFLSMKGLEKYTCDIITHYGNTLPRLVGSGFCHSSLYFLAKYFQDPSVDIQQAARALFSYSLNNMPPEDQQTVIDFWKQFLSSPDSHTNQFMARSTILLAMIAADHPNVLPSKVAKNVALSLTLLLNDESKISHRLAALELCGRGFDIWEPHILFLILAMDFILYSTFDPLTFWDTFQWGSSPPKFIFTGNGWRYECKCS
ncbi:hypothetical protein G9A89_000055 [Geosiphon pyriformis]|nr:hypothetical protein G9A89_000055 [Geosiphon pyriformis]